MRETQQRIKMGRIEGWNLISHKFGAEFILFPSFSSMDTPSMASLCVSSHKSVTKDLEKLFHKRNRKVRRLRQKREGKNKELLTRQIFSSSTLLSRLSPIDILSSVCSTFLSTQIHPIISSSLWSGVERQQQKTEAVKFFIFHLPLARIAWRNFHDFFFVAAVPCWEFGKLFDDVEEILVWRKFFSAFYLLYFLWYMCAWMWLECRVCRRHLTTFRLAVVYMSYFYYICDRWPPTNNR